MARRSVDKLDLSDLEPPMLDDLMKSPQMYAEMQAVARQIMTGYVSRVPHDSGALRATARVTMHRSTRYKDRRWEAEFSVGNSKVDYAAAVEERDHPLGETLRAMGWDVVI